eukprot:TRINITY_DN44363_c0_g1_i1.p1 TRINITY_DN44363_c0_g1~~TRINITY_DN44363_c0_g1_i1.p1  ORF type:complete len:1047 (-),score=164.05 TRINITY_DN44363_c0_g1_i1:189-3002(-)
MADLRRVEAAVEAEKVARQEEVLRMSSDVRLMGSRFREEHCIIQQRLAAEEAKRLEAEAQASALASRLDREGHGAVAGGRDMGTTTASSDTRQGLPGVADAAAGAGRVLQQEASFSSDGTSSESWSRYKPSAIANLSISQLKELQSELSLLRESSGGSAGSAGGSWIGPGGSLSGGHVDASSQASSTTGRDTCDVGAHQSSRGTKVKLRDAAGAPAGTARRRWLADCEESHEKLRRQQAVRGVSGGSDGSDSAGRSDTAGRGVARGGGRSATPPHNTSRGSEVGGKSCGGGSSGSTGTVPSPLDQKRNLRSSVGLPPTGGERITATRGGRGVGSHARGVGLRAIAGPVQESSSTSAAAPNNNCEDDVPVGDASGRSRLARQWSPREMSDPLAYGTSTASPLVKNRRTTSEDTRTLSHRSPEPQVRDSMQTPGLEPTSPEVLSEHSGSVTGVGRIPASTAPRHRPPPSGIAEHGGPVRMPSSRGSGDDHVSHANSICIDRGTRIRSRVAPRCIARASENLASTTSATAASAGGTASSAPVDLPAMGAAVAGETVFEPEPRLGPPRVRTVPVSAQPRMAGLGAVVGRRTFGGFPRVIPPPGEAGWEPDPEARPAETSTRSTATASIDLHRGLSGGGGTGASISTNGTAFGRSFSGEARAEGFGAVSLAVTAAAAAAVIRPAIMSHSRVGVQGSADSANVVPGGRVASAVADEVDEGSLGFSEPTVGSEVAGRIARPIPTSSASQITSVMKASRGGVSDRSAPNSREGTWPQQANQTAPQHSQQLQPPGDLSLRNVGGAGSALTRSPCAGSPQRAAAASLSPRQEFLALPHGTTSRFGTGSPWSETAHRELIRDHTLRENSAPLMGTVHSPFQAAREVSAMGIALRENSAPGVVMGATRAPGLGVGWSNKRSSAQSPSPAFMTAPSLPTCGQSGASRRGR